MSIGKSKNKKEIKKINDDMALMWFNWSVAIIIATLQLLDTYRYIYIYILQILIWLLFNGPFGPQVCAK